MPGKRYVTAVSSLIVLVILLVIAVVVLSIRRRLHRSDTLPITELDIEVVGHDYRLNFRYPGTDRVLHTEDDRQGRQDLYVPAGAVVRLHLNSLDYIYTVEIPAANVYDVAVPDLVFEVPFVLSQSGDYELLGSQMCGYDHPGLLGQVIVQSQSEFTRTMNRLAPAPAQVLP